MKDKTELRKVATHVKGLDRLLFDGIDMSSSQTVVVIRGDDMADRTPCWDFRYSWCGSVFE